MSSLRFWWHSIGRRLILYILLFSSLVTLLGTGLQLYSEYRRDLRAIEEHIHQIETSYLGSLSAGLWSFNERMLEVQLRGILDLPEMRYLEIKRVDGPSLAVGEDQRRHSLVRQFPLRYEHRGRQIELGTLLVVVGLDGVYGRLWDRVLVILGTQMIRTFFVSAFIFLLFYLMVGRHLAAMATYARSLNLHRLDQPLQLPGRASRSCQRDELAQVVAAINEMRQALRAEVQQREKMAEELRQAKKMEAVATLAGGIAHDFNNILTPIIGYCELARMQMSPEELRQWPVDEILKAAHRARDLVAQIMTFSRSRGLERSRLTLQSILKEDMKIMAAEVPRHIRIETDLAADCGAIIADLDRIQQVIFHLCRNAIQAAREGEEGKGVVRLSLKPVTLANPLRRDGEELPPGDYACLEVADDGPGIDPAIRERIFDPYFTTRQFGGGSGLGLGLSLVHGIVKDHGGLVEVESTPGQGALFRVYLPLAEPPDGGSGQDDPGLGVMPKPDQGAPNTALSG
ncbi:MAG: ATP-binding protein [Desulfurivibrio sp.]|nr:ATP-binding protein [Desulfurivibrio sp.]